MKRTDVRIGGWYVYLRAPVEWATEPDFGPHDSLEKAVAAVRRWARRTGHYRPDRLGNEPSVYAAPYDDACVCRHRGDCAMCQVRAVYVEVTRRPTK